MIGMWLSLAVPPALMVAAMLLGRLEGSMLAPRPVPGALVEDQLAAGPAQSTPSAPARPAPEPVRRAAAEPRERIIAPVRPIRAA